MSTKAQPDGAMTIVFLHANGQTPEVREPVIRALPPSLHGIALPIEGISTGDTSTFEIDRAAHAVVAACAERGIDRIVLCGLSVGAMIATEVALASPDLVAGLILSGTQVRPNPVLMRVQSLLMRVLPERVIASQGMTRATALNVSRAVAGIDVRDALRRIRCRTLVACGSRDAANLRAAKDAAALIPGAELHIEPEVGHLWNVTHPDRFVRMIIEFAASLSPQVAAGPSSQ
jgi:3-oxoadipate enol-lactonase